MARKKSRKTLIKNLDSEFSKYIRQRGSVDDIAECFTCGKKDHWKNLDAGHFMSRKNYSTRWDETNVQPQCKACNVFKYGEQYKFGVNLDIHFGTGTADDLFIKSKHMKKFSDSDLIDLIEHYKQLNS